MFLFQAVAMQMRILMQVKQHCEFPDQLWNAFVDMAGNLGADLKLLAALVAAALERAQTRWFCVDRTSGIPCGRVCNLAEKVHLRSFKGGRRLGHMEKSIAIHGPEINTKPYAWTNLDKPESHGAEAQDDAGYRP